MDAMITNSKPATLSEPRSSFGKVVGVVQTQAQLQAISTAMAEAGHLQTEVFEGTGGLAILIGDEKESSHCFLGDMEEAMAHRYVSAAKQGSLVFSIPVGSGNASDVAEIAIAQGAVDVVHIGQWVIRNH